MEARTCLDNAGMNGFCLSDNFIDQKYMLTVLEIKYSIIKNFTLKENKKFLVS